MGKFQGIPSIGKTGGDVARSIVATLVKHPKTRIRLVHCLVEQLLACTSADDAALKLDAIEQADNVGKDQLIRIRDNGATNPTLYEDEAGRSRINALLAKHNVEPMRPKPTVAATIDDDIPF